jgi:hypothetical protein
VSSSQFLASIFGGKNAVLVTSSMRVGFQIFSAPPSAESIFLVDLETKKIAKRKAKN